MVSRCILWHQTWVYNGQPVYYGIKRGFIMASQCIMASNMGLQWSASILWHQTWVYNGQPVYNGIKRGFIMVWTEGWWCLLALSLPIGRLYMSYTYCNLFATMTGFYVFWFPTFLWLSRKCDVMEFFSMVASQVSRLF